MSGIGTLGERSLHAALKYYYEPLEDFHEIEVGRFVADIKRGDKITEIQTQGFDKLRRKLALFLQEYEVTVVFPVAHVKYIEWVDEKTGELKKQRKSPKRGSCYDTFWELYKIKQYLSHPNLKLRIILLEVTERRFENPKNRKGYSRLDTLPHSVSGEMALNKAGDYVKLIPATLEVEFTTQDFAKAAGINDRHAWSALNILQHVGVVENVGKRGRGNLYRRIGD